MTALLTVLWHAIKHKDPISHRQAAQHGTQIRGHDQDNPEIAFLNGGTIKDHPLYRISQGSVRRQETHQ